MNLVKKIVADMKSVSVNSVLYIMTLHLEKDESRSRLVSPRQLRGIYEDVAEVLSAARCHFSGRYDEKYLAPDYLHGGKFKRVNAMEKNWWVCWFIPLRSGEEVWELASAPDDRQWIEVWMTSPSQLPYQVFELGLAERVPEITSYVECEA